MKVILMMGQSNMEGYGQPHELVQLEDFIRATPDPTLQQVYDFLWAAKGQFAMENEVTYASRQFHRHIQNGDVTEDMQGVIPNTYCLSYYNDPTQPFNKTYNRPNIRGALKMGFGARENRDFGPELFIARMMRKYKAVPDDEVLLFVKIASGGTTLYDQWRSPTAAIRLQREKMPNPQAASYFPGAMQLLADLETNFASVLPQVAGQTWQWFGFVWFQGFNDAVKKNERPEMLLSYEDNLVDLVADIRARIGNVFVSIIASQICVNYDFGVSLESAQRSTLRTAQIRAQKRIDKSTSSDSFGINRWYHYGGFGQIHLGVEAGRAFTDLILSGTDANSLAQPPWYPMLSCGDPKFNPASGFFSWGGAANTDNLKRIAVITTNNANTCRSECARRDACKISILRGSQCSVYEDGAVGSFSSAVTPAETNFKVFDKPLGYRYAPIDDDGGATPPPTTTPPATTPPSTGPPGTDDGDGGGASAGGAGAGATASSAQTLFAAGSVAAVLVVATAWHFFGKRQEHLESALAAVVIALLPVLIALAHTTLVKKRGQDAFAFLDDPRERQKALVAGGGTLFLLLSVGLLRPLGNSSLLLMLVAAAPVSVWFIRGLLQEADAGTRDQEDDATPSAAPLRRAETRRIPSPDEAGPVPQPLQRSGRRDTGASIGERAQNFELDTPFFVAAGVTAAAAVVAVVFAMRFRATRFEATTFVVVSTLPVLLYFFYRLYADRLSGAQGPSGRVSPPGTALLATSSVAALVLLIGAYRVAKGRMHSLSLVLLALVLVLPLGLAYLFGITPADSYSPAGKAIGYALYAFCVLAVLSSLYSAAKVHAAVAQQRETQKAWAAYYAGTYAGPDQYSGGAAPRRGRFVFVGALLLLTPVILYAIMYGLGIDLSASTGGGSDNNNDNSDGGTDEGDGPAPPPGTTVSAAPVTDFNNTSFADSAEYTKVHPPLGPNPRLRPGDTYTLDVPSGTRLLQTSASHGTLQISDANGTGRLTYQKTDDFTGEEHLLFQLPDGSKRLLTAGHLDSSVTSDVPNGPTDGLRVDYQVQIAPADILENNEVTRVYKSGRPESSLMLGWHEFYTDTLQLAESRAFSTAACSLSFFYCPPPLGSAEGQCMRLSQSRADDDDTLDLVFEYRGGSLRLLQNGTELVALPIARKMGGDKYVVTLGSTGSGMINNKGASTAGPPASTAITVRRMVFGGPAGGGTWDIRAYNRELSAAEIESVWGVVKWPNPDLEDQATLIPLHYPPLNYAVRTTSTRPRDNLLFYPYMQAVARSSYFMKMGYYRWGNGQSLYPQFVYVFSKGELDKFAYHDWSSNPTRDNWWLHENAHAYQRLEGRAVMEKFEQESLAEMSPAMLDSATLGNLNWYYFGNANSHLFGDMGNQFEGKDASCTFVGYGGFQYGIGIFFAFMFKFVLRNMSAPGLMQNLMGSNFRQGMENLATWETVASRSGRDWVDVIKEMAARMATLDFPFESESYRANASKGFSEGFDRLKMSQTSDGYLSPGCTSANCCSTVRSLWSVFLDPQRGASGGWRIAPNDPWYSLYSWGYQYIPFEPLADGAFSFEFQGDVSLTVVRLRNRRRVGTVTADIQHLPCFFEGERTYFEAPGYVRFRRDDLGIMVFANHNRDIPLKSAGTKIPYQYRIRKIA